MLRSPHLHVVPSSPPPRPGASERTSTGTDAPDGAGPGACPAAPDRGDLALLGMLFGVNLVPLVGEAVAHGRWGPGTLGLATAGALVTGRELLLEGRSLVRRRR